MTIQLSPVIAAERADLGAGFSARRVEPGRLGAAADPIMGFDHYRMNAVTFAPHPHAGFSAVSYLFEDSAGGLRNRDSLGNDFAVGAGGVIWTQAGSGVQHDELPAEPGREVHGLQIFINLSAAAKDTAPEVLHLDGAAVPVHTTPGGSTIRVVVGRYRGTVSELQPLEPADLLDIGIAPGDEIEVPLAAGWNLLVYAESGEVQIAADSGEGELRAGEALAASAPGAAGTVRIASAAGARVVLLGGRALQEPVVQYGPFIMNNEAQIRAAARRYQGGAMGRLEPPA